MAEREDAFDVVIPSMPGYGFSGKPKGTGWNPDRIARAWAELMKRLGYTRYVAQGGDWGSPVSSAMARQAPAGLLGIHINLPATVPPDVAMVLAGGGPAPAGLSEKERAAFDSLDTFYKKYRAYGAIMGTRPQTIGYALTDSPAGLAAWMYDYNNGEPERLLTKDDVLDNVTLYWLTNTRLRRRGCTGRPAAKASFSRPRRRPPRSRSRSPSRCFRRRSIERRRHGPGAPIATSSTSTRSTRAVTSQRGSSRSFSAPSFEPRSDHFGRHADQPGLPSERRKEIHMKTTRILAAAALIVASGLAPARGAGAAARESSAPICSGTISASPGREVVQVRVDFAPGVAFPKHSHPGEEIVNVIEGLLEYAARGQAAGDAQGRRRLVHPGRNDPRGEERRQRQRGGARHVHR